MHQRIEDVGNDRSEDDRIQKGPKAVQSLPDRAQVREDREKDDRGAGCDRIGDPGGVEIVLVK